jgi:hypothetical protein
MIKIVSREGRIFSDFSNSIAEASAANIRLTQAVIEYVNSIAKDITRVMTVA